jgi:hypothetical protein
LSQLPLIGGKVLSESVSNYLNRYVCLDHSGLHFHTASAGSSPIVAHRQSVQLPLPIEVFFIPMGTARAIRGRPKQKHEQGSGIIFLNWKPNPRPSTE